MLTKFSKTSQHKMSWQLVQWFLSCFMHENEQRTFNTCLTGLSMCLKRTGKEWTPDSCLATEQKSLLPCRPKPFILQTHFRLTTDSDVLTKSIWNIQVEYWIKSITLLHLWIYERVHMIYTPYHKIPFLNSYWAFWVMTQCGQLLGVLCCSGT